MNPAMLAMVVSSLCFPMLGVVVRAVRQQDDVFTVMFFSGLLNCIALWTVLLVREKRGALRTSIPHVHLIRGALGALCATSIVYSMKFVQVDLALTVLMSSPVWSALLAWAKARGLLVSVSTVDSVCLLYTSDAADE